MMKFNNDGFYFCYNKKLSLLLGEHGYKPITVAINPSSNRRFSLYQIDEQMDQLIEQFYENNNR